MASFGENFSVGNGNQFAGSNSFAGGGGGMPFAGGGGMPFAGGGAGGFNGSWDFGTNNPSSQDNGFMGGNSKPEAVPESTSSIAIAIAGLTCLLMSRLKKATHS